MKPTEDDLSKKKINAALEILDDLIDNEAWDESNFIRAIGKSLREIREEFVNEAQLGHEKIKVTSHIANRIALRSGQQQIYIALYSSEGSNLASWERILNNLPRQVISRPVYADENDIKAIIKTKENKMNEAYVAIYINQADILPVAADKAPVDKLGKSLLSLKDKTLNLDNVSFFVHETGIYHYTDGHLVKERS